MSSDAGGVFQFLGALAAIYAERYGQDEEGGFALPFSALLSRIRALIPRRHDDHYEEIVRGFGNGALRAPATPMSDRELSQAIAEFLRGAPSVDTVGTLGRRLDPSAPL